MSRIGAMLIIGIVSGFPVAALAYVGPGAGLTMLGSLWGLILAVLFVLFGVLILPVKLLMNKRRKAREQAAEAVAEDPGLQSDAEEPADPQSG